MELLIVMAIITVLMLIGFPTYRSVMKHSRELSAKKSMQTIQQAEMMYSTNYPSKGFACNLQYLGGDASKPPSATASEMLPDELAKGNKDGYIFTITNCAKNALNGSERVDGYTLTAVPEAVSDRGYQTVPGRQPSRFRPGRERSSPSPPLRPPPVSSQPGC